MRFCDRYIERRNRTHDQMEQTARSGVQNIAEGSQDTTIQSPDKGTVLSGRANELMGNLCVLPNKHILSGSKLILSPGKSTESAGHFI